MSRSPKSDDENGCYGSTSRTIVDSFSYKIVQFLGFKQVLGIVFLFVWIPVCLWVGGLILNLNFSQSNRDCSASECIFLHGGCLPIRARGFRGSKQRVGNAHARPQQGSKFDHASMQFPLRVAFGVTSGHQRVQILLGVSIKIIPLRLLSELTRGSFHSLK